MEGDGVATVTVMVLSGKLDRSLHVHFNTTDDGTATSEMGHCGDSIQI